MIINLPKRRLVLGESGNNMTEKKSILNLLFAILVFFALGFSIWGCGDSDSINQPEPLASYVGIFGHSQDPDQGWYATTTLENLGKEMGQVLAENKPQYDCWDSATGFMLGDEQYVLSQDSDNQWMITRILPMGHLGARTDFGVWETQEVMCSLKIGSQPYIFGHRGNGAWEILPILSGGKMGAQTDAGEWDKSYRSMAGFQMADGRSFVFGQSEDDNDWFISEILSNGKMGARTDEGHWDTYYKTVVVFQMHNGGTYIFGQDQSDNAWFMARILSGGKMGARTDEGAMAYFNDSLTAYQAGNKSYMFGQNQTNNDWSIHEILSGGIMGNQTDSGQTEYFYHVLFPVSYDPVYLNTSTWMTENYSTIKDRTLKEIALPGSHDSGMYKQQVCFLGGDECNTVAQELSTEDQLEAGARYLDVRPVFLYEKGNEKGTWYTGHFGQLFKDKYGKHYAGCTGQSLEGSAGLFTEIKNYFNKIDDNNKEILIVDFSHCFYFKWDSSLHELSYIKHDCTNEQMTEIIYEIGLNELSEHMLHLECNEIDCSDLLSLKYEELMLGGGHVIFRVPQFANESKAVALGSTSDGEGYWIVDGAGITYAFGDAYPFESGTPGGAAVDMGVTPSGDGYWLLDEEGQVYTYGDAGYHEGGTGGVTAAALGVTPTGEGYWLLNENGEIYAYGDADYHGGGTGGVKAVDMAATSTGKGYWLLNENGQIYAYGDADPNLGGGTGGVTAVAMDVLPTGNGYWLLNENGQIYAYGDADPNLGGGTGDYKAVNMNVTPTGNGYWLMNEEGQVYAYGDAQWYGNPSYEDYSQGVVHGSHLGIYNKYAHKYEISEMMTDQEEKYMTEKHHDNMFLLSWTCTLTDLMEADCAGLPYEPSWIIPQAKNARPWLFSQIDYWFDNHLLYPSFMPNIVYTDATNDDTTQAAIYVNQTLPTPANGKMGFWLLNIFGEIYSYGDADYYGGGTGGVYAVAMAVTPTGNGYWLMNENGQIYAYGDADPNYGGGTGGVTAVAMSATPTGNGYWLLNENGEIYAYGDAGYYGGGTGGVKAVGMAATPTGSGYWLMNENGQIYAYGDADYYGGGTGGVKAVGMAAIPTGSGYWLMNENGQIFAYGDADYYGGGCEDNAAMAMGITPTGEGYWILAKTGAVFWYGDAEPVYSETGGYVAVAMGVSPNLSSNESEANDK